MPPLPIAGCLLLKRRQGAKLFRERQAARPTAPGASSAYNEAPARRIAWAISPASETPHELTGILLRQQNPHHMRRGTALLPRYHQARRDLRRPSSPRTGQGSTCRTATDAKRFVGDERVDSPQPAQHQAAARFLAPQRHTLASRRGQLQSSTRLLSKALFRAIFSTSRAKARSGKRLVLRL
jgi:hypothetical protein